MLEEWKLDIEKCKSLKELLAYRNYCKFECMDSVRKIKVLEAKEEKYRQQIHKIDQILEECTSKQKLITSKILFEQHRLWGFRLSAFLSVFLQKKPV